MSALSAIIGTCSVFAEQKPTTSNDQICNTVEAFPHAMLLSATQQLSTMADTADSDSSERKTSKFSDTCVVCGDQSTGYHYEVSSCNGCKTFFRRTIVAHRTYKCHKSGNCIFNKDIRCACRACRFAKCLAVGMNPKAIQCNRTGRIASPNNPPSPPQDPTAASFAPSSFQPSVIYAANSSLTDDKTQVENSQTTSSCASSPNSERSAYKRAYTVSALLDLPQFSTSPSDKESRKISNSILSLCVKEASEVCDETPSKRPKRDSSEKLIMRLLTLQENVSRLRNSVYEASDSILDLLTRPCAMDDMSEYMNQKKETELGIAEQLNLDVALAVEYAKSFDVFRRMPLKDKFFLLRDVTLVLSLFESAYQSFLRKNSSSALEAVVKLEPNDASYEQGSPVQLATESLVRAEIGRSEYVLLKAIVFLHAECFGLSSKSYKQLVENRQLVLDALFDYMMSTYGKQGPVKYGNVLSVSWTLFKTAQRYKESVERLNLEPLCEEILSSKLPTRLI